MRGKRNRAYYYGAAATCQFGNAACLGVQSAEFSIVVFAAGANIVATQGAKTFGQSSQNVGPVNQR